jgi:hypothetical protein
MLINTNDRPIVWTQPTTWYANGTRTTNAPALSRYNNIVLDWTRGSLRGGVVSTNATDVP